MVWAGARGRGYPGDPGELRVPAEGWVRQSYVRHEERPEAYSEGHP